MNTNHLAPLDPSNIYTLNPNASASDLMDVFDVRSSYAKSLALIGTACNDFKIFKDGSTTENIFHLLSDILNEMTFLNEEIINKLELAQEKKKI